jgi:serine/threonine protein phosphatase PrpC
MTRVRPRDSVHRGVVHAAGWFFCSRLYPKRVARGRILAGSDQGARVFLTKRGFVVELSEPRWVDCSCSPGTPLVRENDVLWAAPLRGNERERLAAALDEVAPAAGATGTPRPGLVAAAGSMDRGTSGRRGRAAVVVDGGSARVLGLDAAVLEDPAEWIDVSAFSFDHLCRPLGRVTDAPADALPPTVSDVRTALKVATTPPELEAALEELRCRGAAPQATGGTGAPQSRGAWGVHFVVSVALAVVSGLARLVSALGRLFRRSGGDGDAATNRGREWRSPASGTSKARASALDAVRSWLQRALARWAVRARVGHLIGRRQAEYLARVLEMFARSEFDEALRHAIPLDPGIEAALRPPALGLPSPRQDLSIVAQRAPSRSAFGVTGDFFTELRKTYRRAFERLDAAGQYEKAAFVLAELLNAAEEAVSYLERHGRTKLAAEIAEARGLPPGLVVRQWFLAKDRERAIRLARRSGAFGDAVARLEPTHPEEAASLRLLWGDSLASSGAYAAAVDVVWREPAARHIAEGWMRRAIEVGGLQGARMLARSAQLDREHFAAERDRCLALLHDCSKVSRSLRKAFVQELLSDPASPEARTLLRVAARALLPVAQDGDARRLVDRLLIASDDTALRTDARGFGGAQRVAGDAAPSSLRFESYVKTDVGLKRVHNEDAACVASLGQRSTYSYAGKLHGAAGDGALFGVFDGCGGRAAGNVASEAARDFVVHRMSRIEAGEHDDVRAVSRVLCQAVEHAGREIHVDATTNPARTGMGTTATVAALVGTTVCIAHVGDTRAYLLRCNRLTQLTRDHSLLNQLIEAGKLTPAEIEDFPHKNVITRALGTAPDVPADLYRVQVQGDDMLLLCSDGVHAVLSSDEIEAALRDHARPADACAALIARAHTHGAPDNSAVVVVRLRGSDAHVRQVPQRHVLCNRVPLEAEAESEDLSLASRVCPIDIERDAADVGAMAVHDAATLPGGRILMALGEAGVRLVAPDGRTIFHAHEPAHRLVVSDHGDRAIALARRGEAWRLARIDLVSRRVRPWCDALVSAFATDFDGSLWFVAGEDRVFAVDALDDRWDALWSVEAQTRQLARSPTKLEMLVAPADDPDTSELWLYDLPSLHLRRRLVVESGEAIMPLSAVSASGAIASWHQDDDRGMSAWLFRDGRWRRLDLSPATSSGAPVLSERWAAFPCATPDGRGLALFDIAEGLPRAHVGLRGASIAAARLQAERLVVCDDRGRVLVISLEDGEVVQELRVS